MLPLPIDRIERLLGELIEDRQPDPEDTLCLLDTLRRCQAGFSWLESVGLRGTLGTRLRDELLCEAAALLAEGSSLSLWQLAGLLAEQIRHHGRRSDSGRLHELLTQAKRCGRLPESPQGVFNVLRR